MAFFLRNFNPLVFNYYRKVIMSIIGHISLNSTVTCMSNYLSSSSFADNMTLHETYCGQVEPTEVLSHDNTMNLHLATIGEWFPERRYFIAAFKQGEFQKNSFKFTIVSKS